MSTATSIQLLPRGSLRRHPTTRRLPRALWIVLAVLASWSAEYGVYRAFEPPGPALRRELLGAADELRAPWVPQPTTALRQAIRRHFRESDIDIDTARYWPNVVVSLHGVSRDGCAAAVPETRRIEGPVVVALERYRSAAECGERNDMIWWLMP
ncbi:MAG TPA: hypothetical protein VEI03_14300 [Stellaceae bacterium]|nr:hypothetical protein [Stellaceae bacterium]